jgi:hypothetical protein
MGIPRYVMAVYARMCRMTISIGAGVCTVLKNWFADHVRSFADPDPRIQENIDLKNLHSRSVARESVRLGKELGLRNGGLRLAEIIGLLHDVGRFEQYARFRTFVDRTSVNHAELGTRILTAAGILEAIRPDVRNVILKSIAWHNRPSLPEEDTETVLFHAKLLRDADKLDIWKVVIEYYEQEGGRHNEAIELGLPDTPGISEDVRRDLLNGSAVNVSHVRNLNDFKLLQVGWIFDINFDPTKSAIRERHYLERLRAVLPDSREIEEIFEFIRIS